MRKISQRIVAEITIGKGCLREGAVAADQKSEPVWPRPRNMPGAQRGRGARPMIHDEITAEAFGEAIHHHTGNDIGSAARRERDDDGDRASVGPAIRAAALGTRQGRKGQCTGQPQRLPPRQHRRQLRKKAQLPSASGRKAWSAGVSATGLR
jgi:hypothetical protein